MKKFVSVVFSMKLNACLCFTAFTIFYALAEIISGYPLLSGWRALQLLVFSVICGALQYVFFSERVLKKMPYVRRVLLFGLCLLAVLAPFAVLCGWFPVGEPLSWLIFLAVFVALLLVLTAVFEVIYRITGRRYTSLLEERQSKS